MSCPCSFPDSISFGCAVELAKMVTSGKLLDQKGDAIKHLACLIGSVGNQFGDDVPTPVIGSQDDEALCQQIIDECESVPDAVGAVAAVPFWVWPLVQLVLRRLLG